MTKANLASRSSAAAGSAEKAAASLAGRMYAQLGKSTSGTSISPGARAAALFTLRTLPQSHDGLCTGYGEYCTEEEFCEKEGTKTKVN